MKRSVLVLVLLVSVGMNAGILATLLLDRWRTPEPPASQRAQPERARPQGAPPKGSPTQGLPPQETVPQQTVPQETVPQQTVPQGAQPEGAVGGLVDRLVQRLGLEGEVAERFRELQFDLYQQMRGNRRRAMQVQFRLRRELAGDQPDGEVLRVLVEDSGRLHAERQELLVRAILKSREILDRQQQREYQNFLSLLGRHLERRRNAPQREQMRRRMLQRRNSNGSP
ncbi:MAG: hypothetical protein SX243_16525 [Acidobacteriota bacterium]|nr:hypothetical protein [Acidobacteriota bacterium]